MEIRIASVLRGLGNFGADEVLRVVVRTGGHVSDWTGLLMCSKLEMWKLNDFVEDVLRGGIEVLIS